MARLLIKTPGNENSLIELKLGVNRIGRSADAEFQIFHPTVSSLHCELVLKEDGVVLRDLESTNGTFVDGRMIREARLTTGQHVRLGDVEMVVESTEVVIAIPKFSNSELPAPPVVRPDGSLVCPRHPQAQVSYQCSRCLEVMCELCVHRLRRRRGATTLLLCPVCSGSVEALGDTQKVIHRHKSLLARLTETVKLKLTRIIRLRDSDP